MPSRRNYKALADDLDRLERGDLPPHSSNLYDVLYKLREVGVGTGVARQPYWKDFKKAIEKHGGAIVEGSGKNGKLVYKLRPWTRTTHETGDQTHNPSSSYQQDRQAAMDLLQFQGSGTMPQWPTSSMGRAIAAAPAGSGQNYDGPQQATYTQPVRLEEVATPTPFSAGPNDYSETQNMTTSMAHMSIAAPTPHPSTHADYGSGGIEHIETSGRTYDSLYDRNAYMHDYQYYGQGEGSQPSYVSDADRQDYATELPQNEYFLASDERSLNVSGVSSDGEPATEESPHRHKRKHGGSSKEKRSKRGRGN